MKHLKNTTVVFCVLLLMMLVVPAMAASAGTSVKGKGGKIRPITYKPGEVIVTWKDGASAANKASVKSSAGVERALTTTGSRVKADRELLKLKPGVSTEKAAGALRKSSAVKAAGFNWLRKLSYTPSSPDFPKQWPLNNTGQTIGDQTGTPDADIDAPEAWDIERGNSNATTVAVIDSGVDLNHHNLSGRLWTNSADPVDGIDNDGNGYVDDNHGYNWAGISSYGATSYHPFGQDASSQFVAQKFRAQGVNGRCPIAGLEMFVTGKTGNPTQTITYAIRSSLTGPDIVATNPISPSRIATGSWSFINEPFKSVANLTPGNNYFFVVYTSAADASNYYNIAYNEYDWAGYDSYVEGSEWRNVNGVWTEYPSDDFYFKSSGYYYNRDNNGHGTHCCGIVGAADSGAGSVGVAPGDATRIMALKAADSSGSLWSSDYMDAIDYASSMGADIASMSFGGAQHDPAEQTVITNAYNNGVALFASSGNSGDSTMLYPAGFDNVIGVGATDNRDDPAYFSTYNSSVDLSAPGVKYYSTMPTYPVTLNGFGYAKNYDYLSGTSMACPCAAGTGALVRSKNPAYTPAQIQGRLQSMADDLGNTGRDDYFGYGRINAFRALTNDNFVPTVTSLDPTRRVAGQRAFTLTVNGFHFIAGSKVRWNGADRTTTHVSASQLTAAIPASDITSVGTADVTVFNSTPGGGTSTPALTFTINQVPVPTTGGTIWTDTGGAVSGYEIDSLACDSMRNLLYAGTAWNGVWKYDGTTWTDTGGAVSNYRIDSLAFDSTHNTLYAGGTQLKGVWKYDGTTWTDTGGELSGYRTESLAYDSTHNTLYAATNGYGVWKYDGTTWTDTGGGMSRFQLGSIACDSTHNTLYAEIAGNGVWKYDGTTWTDTGGGMSSFSISSLAYDSTHSTLYAGTWGLNGVWKYNGTTWTDTGGGMSSYEIPSIACDSVHKVLYAGTYLNGVWKYDGTTWTDTGGGMSSFYVGSLEYDSAHDKLYAGTRNYSPSVVGVWCCTTGLSPTSKMAGDPAFTLTVNGTNFVDGLSVVRWNGTDRNSAYQSDTRLTAAITAEDIATPGAASVTVFNPAPGGGESNPQTFTIVNPHGPTVISISPNTGVAGGTVNLTDLAGVGFQAGATVRLEAGATVVNATNVIVVSGTKITCQFVLPATLGKYDVVVKNPDGQEGRLIRGFSVTNSCGQGAGASISLLAGALGLLSMAGLGRRRRRRL